MILSKELVIKYLSGQITEKELLVLESLLADAANREEFRKYAEDHYLVNKTLTSLDLEKEYTAIFHRINIKKKQRIQVFYRIAAILVIVLGVGLYMKLSVLSPTDVSPDTITIKLNDGKIKKLSEEGVSNILDKEGNTIARHNGNTINYRYRSDDSTSPKKAVYNELSVPFGKKFRLLLEDGTKVSLNAGSRLKFPVAFLENGPREVFLEGEAFFDVAKDRQRPFMVNSNGFHVRVLGTKFNVNSYTEDKSVSTVLVEGSVGLYSDSENDLPKDNMIKLSPGELAVYNRNDRSLQVKDVDTAEYIAWVDGVLLFKIRPFSEIIRVLERHYNVQITNRYKELGNKRFFARFDVESIEEVLRSFQGSEPFSYQINGDNIIIDKP
ncbi:DUF4974 domain-containing protein [Sinomicrobium kalidii]|uniref:FecR family protein n=1 Tax=Sinomicrobium kalidii TaxID=2900738 RepID=UPI001E47ABED|nr:FecR domain-containing protein [Sinomicrobium kalidii]UGU15483.1 DUF4974 domain-containing protein [Sinomicrobium kalidii]